MPLVEQPFADTFTFARGRTAPYRDAAGAEVTAAVDAPRFDHDADGAALGLLIEGRPQFNAADRLRAVTGDWIQPGGTVLHHWVDPEGVERRQAWFSPTNPKGTVDGCLNLKGHHRLIAFVASYLPVKANQVYWRRRLWAVGGLIAVGPGVALGVTSTTLFLEG